ncbi:MAG: uracil-DNA glycosylase [Chitinivibrionales bacterium]|nr:uracil-DNA glycosylase [Chitinivibrionales bacterium]
MPDHIFSRPFDSEATGYALTSQETAFASGSGTPAPVREKSVHLSGDEGQSVKTPAVKSDKDDTRKREKLKELYYEFKECHHCSLGTTRKNFIFGAGNVLAPLMIIGEAPGAEEDQKGLPFVGKAGQLLTKMLKAIDLNRKNHIFITNVLKCRPPANRNPESTEITLCLPLLKRQIEIIKPEALLLLGRIAAHALLGKSESIGALRTMTNTYNEIPVVVTYHPAALLRNETYKRPAWEDLQKLRDILMQRGVYAES